jgi:hypothetical protein
MGPRNLTIALLLCFGCAHGNRAALYTEDGLRAAESAWDAYYRAEAARCERLHEPRTPEMEACFGNTYDADGRVGTAVQSAVSLLRAYWAARAAGGRPDLQALLQQVAAIVRDLPPEARAYFDKVKGL